jgi:hypothetical protein
MYNVQKVCDFSKKRIIEIKRMIGSDENRICFGWDSNSRSQMYLNRNHVAS